MKKIAEIIVNILTIVVFCVLVVVIFAKVKVLLSGNDYFDIFGYSFFNVATGSMKPEINQNDIIIVKSFDNYVINDIVTYKKDNDYITHRVVMVNDNNLITKGDANNTTDSAITMDDVLGKVVKVLPNAGVWQKTLTSPKVVIMVFITLLLFDFAFSYKGKKNENDKTIKNEPKIDINKLSHEELNAIYEKVNNVTSKKEKQNLEYTIGLDLSSIQKEIKSKLDKGE